MTMTAKELRQKFLNFFKTKNHAIIPGASLIPENDPSALFISAGMHPLVPFLMGEKHPQGQRLANVQKCLRTVDIDQVGDFYHHTFFEMLGNWSLADYFKKEAIAWSWEFLTSPKWLGLDKNLLAISVFAGDEDASFDQESFQIWRELGMAEKRIAKLSKKDNWWGLAGQTGPCGPDTEMFYWVGPKDQAPEEFDPDNELWVEIWNDVFMEYNKTAEGRYELLSQKNVDTGMGLERTLAVLNGLNDDYQTELWLNLIKKIEELSGKKYEQTEKITRAMRIMADHLKASVFVLSEGLVPSNLDRGYILRRLIRRAIRYGRQLEIKQDLWTKEIAQVVISDYQEIYHELEKNSAFIISQLQEEEAKFSKTLERGLRQFQKIEKRGISGKEAFDLYQTYGFPFEMTKELAQERGVKINEKEFQKELGKHQELSRTASAGKFKGGLADASEETKKLHTAAHLLLAALRQVLGDQIIQKGSNITAERLRFDFSHSEKMTEEQKQQVENLVNQAIGKDLPVVCEEMSLEEARQKGAMGVFESKYGERVKVYQIGKGEELFSKEICGGPHVERTGQFGHFKIIKEESSSAGVRRIKAILENK